MASYDRSFCSEFAGILQVEIRQPVSGVCMLIPIFGEESMRPSCRVIHGKIGILRTAYRFLDEPLIRDDALFLDPLVLVDEH